MLERGIDQWAPGSQTRMEILTQVDRGEWFRLVGEGRRPDGGDSTSRDELLAAVRLLDADPDFWDDDVASALYVHGLMVDLPAAGRGLGEQVLELAAAEGRRRGRALLRLDCAPHLVAYYCRFGFASVRRKEFPAFTTVLLERPLRPTLTPTPTPTPTP